MCKIPILVTLVVTILRPCCGFNFSFDHSTQSEILHALRNAFIDNSAGNVFSEDCKNQMNLLWSNIKNPEGNNNWGLRMIDAWGKPEPGLLESNVVWHGRFEECLNIKSSDVKGRYCKVDLEDWTPGSPFIKTHQVLTTIARRYLPRLESSTDDNDEWNVTSPLLPSIGICVPDKCSSADIKKILPSNFHVHCQTLDTIYPPVDTGFVVTICFFGFFVCLMVASTAYDILRSENRKHHPLVLAFSVYTNGRKLLKVSDNAGEFSCLHGIRFFSILWVIYGHTFAYIILSSGSKNVLDLLQYFQTTKGMIILNAPYAVDTFFVITGLLVVYSFMKAKSQGNTFNIFLFYLHRFLRITPALVPLLIVYLYFVKYMGTGPNFPAIAGSLGNPCRKSWWSVLLHVQNYMEDTPSCLVMTWYLDVDWQIYVASPIFLLFLPKYPIIGLLIMLSGSVGSMLYVFYITWVKELPAILQTTLNVMDYIKYYYLKTHTRMTTWLIGGLLGYALAKIFLEHRNFHKKIPKWVFHITWFVVLVTIPVCIFAGGDVLHSTNYHRYANAFYNTFSRPAWGLCIAWIIFACSVGHGGIINSILSWPAFQVLSRFTFSIYLLHILVINVVMFNQRDTLYFSILGQFILFCGVWVLTFGISMFWVLAFESPIIILEKYLLETFGVKTKKKDPVEIHTKEPISTIKNGVP